MINIEWANEEQTVIRWHLSDGWTWDEFYAAKAESEAMIEQVTGVVDGLFVMDNPSYLPAYFLANLRIIVPNSHPRYGITIVVGKQKAMRFIFDCVVRITSRDDLLYLVNTEEEAFARIQQLRQPMVGGA